ncbi:hypothetical protein KZX46_20900 [Polymorphobacter sp. PAMC 29334]|nr:hypothetical protein KZX46_20900 [Polymorphobacter sp. PAMC 29334]
MLGHTDQKSTTRYSRLANDSLMKAVEAGAAKLMIAAFSSDLIDPDMM